MIRRTDRRQGEREERKESVMQHVRNTELTRAEKSAPAEGKQPWSPTARKVADGAVAVREAVPGEEDIAYFHSVLTQVSLPRRKMTERVFERTSGHVSLRINAG